MVDRGPKPKRQGTRGVYAWHMVCVCIVYHRVHTVGGERLGIVAREGLVSACLFGALYVSFAVLAGQNRWGRIVGGALLFGA